MPAIQIDPPGTWCTNHAFLEMISPLATGDTFIEIGPGEGGVSRILCSKGLTGTGIDFSPIAVERLAIAMGEYIEAGVYSIIEADVLKEELPVKADLVFCMMVLEHVEDEAAFLQRMRGMVKAGGMLLVAVPGRKGKWGVEDELCGHYRRYERGDLLGLFGELGLVDTQVWSVAVPVGNLLFGLSNMAIRNSQMAVRRTLSKQEQTKLSGLRDVPFKTIFPSWTRLVLNRYTMHPFMVAQRLFYRTGLGLSLLACGRIP